MCFCCDITFAKQQTPFKRISNTVDQETIGKFNSAIRTIVSLTKDNVLVNKNGVVQNVSLHNFFLKKNKFPLVLFLRVNNRKRFLTYESCVSAPYSDYLNFLKTKNIQYHYERTKDFVEFSEKTMGIKFKWATVCSINNKLKIAQIDNVIKWPKDNFKNSKVVMGISVSKWAWKKHKVASMLEKNGNFISFW